MAKFYGPIGFAETVETKPGIWTNQIVEHNYYCEVKDFTSKWSTSSDSTNDDLNITSQFSIIADPFAYQNLESMKYITYMGTKWKILTVKPNYPRLIMTTGGVFNE